MLFPRAYRPSIASSADTSRKTLRLRRTTFDGEDQLNDWAAIQHCIRGIRTRLVSLEMTSEELLHRIFAAVSEVPFERLIDASCLTKEESTTVQHAKSLVAKWPLEIDDRDAQTIDFALAGCRMSCRRRKTGFIAVDYVQNLRFVGPGKLRYMEISDAAKKLRQFAKEEGIPVLLLSSITETQEKNPNKRPTLATSAGLEILPSMRTSPFSSTVSGEKTAPASKGALKWWWQSSAAAAPAWLIRNTTRKVCCSKTARRNGVLSSIHHILRSRRPGSAASRVAL